MHPSIDPDQAWRRSGARCCVGVIIAFEILLAVVSLSIRFDHIHLQFSFFFLIDSTRH